jgi:ABC-2 type transport system ATP-binding protein
MGKSLISINNLNKSFTLQKEISQLGSRKINVLQNFNFKSDKPDIIGLIGEKNSGKTTLFKILIGCIPPCSGEVNVLGLKPNFRDTKYSTQIGFVSGLKFTDSTLPIQESLSLLAYLLNIPEVEFKQRCLKLIRDFQFNQLLNIPINQLNNMEKIQFELICALIHNPKIVFIDNIIDDLNSQILEKVKSLILEYHKKEKTSFIIFSQNKDKIDNICQNLVQIKQNEF